MPEPFTASSASEAKEKGFRTPEEEIQYLRAEIAERERKLVEMGHQPEREATTYEALQKYKAHPPEAVLHESQQMSQSEVEAFVLDLPPDDDDEAVRELLHVVAEKGVKNALMVAAEVGNPHLEDDFHRALVQYVAHGYQAPDMPESSGLYNVLNKALFEVTLPEMTGEGAERPLSEIISAMEQFYLGMFAMDHEIETDKDRYFSLEIAVSSEREDIVFYVAVPKDKEHLFEKQLLAAFPKARAHYVPEDYNVFLHDGETAVAYATLEADPILPLKDYQSFDHDPLSVLINAFTKLAPVGEGAALQLIINPAGLRYNKRYKVVLEKLEKGMKLRDALRDTPEGIGGEFAKTFRDLFAQKKSGADGLDEKHVDQTCVEQVQNKIATPIGAVNIRIIGSATTEARARAIVSDIVSSYNQFNNTSGNRLKFEFLTGKKASIRAKKFMFREYDHENSMYLSVREITTLLHFPTHAVGGIPQLKRLQAAVAPAPIGMPQTGTVLGINSYRGVDTEIHFTDEDRLRHLYVIGQTGTGKSAFLRTLIKQDIDNGHGVCFIDPHGNDIEDVLSNIPEERFKDVIYFDPADTEHVLGLNMLEYDPRRPDQKTFVINELFSIFRKLYSDSPESMGPAFEQYFRNATALVLEDPSTGCTMLDISRVLADAKYREVKLSRSQNPVVNQFWREIATKAQGEASLANIVPYITNKFDIFTANDIMRPIIAQQKSAFRMREVMDSRKILLVNLSKGRLGDINANLLGMVLVGKILMAALSRVDALASDLPPFYLYIDEFQNISTNSISAILSEARKYKLSLNMAHQFIAQLDEGIRDSVFGNVGSMAIFRVGTEDAKFLETHLAPVFETQDIMNIQNWHAYIRMLANGTPQKPFSIKTLHYTKGSTERAAYIKQLSASTYGRAKEEIEREVRMRYSIE
jgi:hypothetical protein